MKQRPARIALFTDFGEAGPYLGQMEAVLYAAGVQVPVIRLLSDAPRCNPRAAAYLLAAIARCMPPSTLFLAVVDPGVGSPRRPLVVHCDGNWFVGPDNGLFSQVACRAGQVEVERIDWRPERLSSSFHGRDLFAPAAADITIGRGGGRSRATVGSLVGCDWPHDLAEVIYIDHYGNCMTGVDAESVDVTTVFVAGGWSVGYAETFSAVPAGEPFWYRNSVGLVEVAVNLGRADTKLGLAVGDCVASG